MARCDPAEGFEQKPKAENSGKELFSLLRDLLRGIAQGNIVG
jgi:hypothetical protein